MNSCVADITPDDGLSQTTCMTLDEAMGQARSEAAQQSNFADIASRAVGQATTRPAVQNDFMQAERDALSGPGSGAVGDAKQQVLSDVERPGAAKRDDNVDGADQGEQLEDRVRSLYLELTNYQVAWKIAQRIQQDTSQLLRGQ